MVWFIRKKEKEPEIQPIMEPVENPDLKPSPNELRAEAARPELVEVHARDSAPLFVKIDRYKELLSYLHLLRLGMTNLKDLMCVLKTTQEMLKETNGALELTIEKTNAYLSSMDTELLKPRGIDIDIEEDSRRTEMRMTLEELNIHLEKLRQEVRSISK